MTTKSRFAGSALAIAVLAIATVVIVSGSVTAFAAPPPSGPFCGGIAGIPCSDGCVCVDDPRDDCNPKKGGADCSGICRPAPGSPNQTCTNGSEAIVDGSFGACDPAREPGVGENLSCSEAYTCTADGVWLCINLDGTPTL